MLHNKSFVKKTKKGQLLKVVREHYLRDDIQSGSPLDKECEEEYYKLSANASHYVIIDTNVALNQADFLEHPSINDVIILSNVIEEVKHKNPSSYQRLKDIIANPQKRFFVFANMHHRQTFDKVGEGESPNNYNDRLIRLATKWYIGKIPKMQVILVTADQENRQRAKEDGILSLSVQAYCKQFHKDDSEMLDKLNDLDGQEQDSQENGNAQKKKKIYQEHMPLSQIQENIKNGKLHQGTLKVNRFNPFEGYVTSLSSGEYIKVSGRLNMNRSLDGDVVAVQLITSQENLVDGQIARQINQENQEEDLQEDGQEKPGTGILDEIQPEELIGGDGHMEGGQIYGKVIGVIKRNWRSRGYCGSIKRSEKNDRKGPQSVMFIPIEKRYPQIRISTRQSSALQDKRIVVQIDNWPVDSIYPQGHYQSTIGDVGDRDIETQVILMEHDVDQSPFSSAVYACLPPLPWHVSELDVKTPYRKDLRNLCVMSVDPPGCKDIDDAVHLRELDNGNYEVGVHIADVTNFVHYDTPLDQEALKRSTTVYLVQRRIDMLPKALTEDICSLREKVDRLAFSVLWEIDKDGNIIETSFTKSIIRSRAAMTYFQAQTRIDDQNSNDEITLSLRKLNSFAQIFRKRRIKNGALQLASPEVRFELDTETLDPTDVSVYKSHQTNQMIEEYMLLANISVAKNLLQHFPRNSLLRRHQQPSPQMFEPAIKAMQKIDMTLLVDNSAKLAQSLDMAQKPNDQFFNVLIRIMTTRCMTQAQYIGSGQKNLTSQTANEGDVAQESKFYHYGLATPYYTHFTSPIRRYADVIVHRQLSAVLGLNQLYQQYRDIQVLEGICDNLNYRHRNAQMAGRASVELHTIIYFRNKVVFTDARVTKVQKKGVVVFLTKYGIEGPLHIEKDRSTKQLDSRYTLDDANQIFTLQFDGAGQSLTKFNLFDRIGVKISVEDTPSMRSYLKLEAVPYKDIPEKQKAS